MADATERNVLGEDLEPCGTEPMTGFFRDGCCSTGPEDLGSHTICAVVSAEFLEHQRSIGNDLSTPNPGYGFPGLNPATAGASRRPTGPRPQRRRRSARRARRDQRAVLEIVPLEVLRQYAVDVPGDLSGVADLVRQVDLAGISANGLHRLRRASWSPNCPFLEHV